jgi:hypothetical protein
MSFLPLMGFLRSIALPLTALPPTALLQIALRPIALRPISLRPISLRPPMGLLQPTSCCLLRFCWPASSQPNPLAADES